MKNKNTIDNVFRYLKYFLIICLIFIAVASFGLFAEYVKNLNDLNELGNTQNLSEVKSPLIFSAIFYFCCGLSSLGCIALIEYNIAKNSMLNMKLNDFDSFLEKLSTTTCKNCGKKLSIDEKFCPNCGAKNEIKKEILSHQSEQNTQEEKENH